MVDAGQLEEIAPDAEVVVGEEGDERLEIVPVRIDGVARDVPFVAEVIEKIADFRLHARRSRNEGSR
jgi:hypothetical protein